MIPPVRDPEVVHRPKISKLLYEALMHANVVTG